MNDKVTSHEEKKDGMYVTVRKEGKESSIFVSLDIIRHLEGLHTTDALEDLMRIIKPDIKYMLDGEEPKSGMYQGEFM